MKRLFWSFEFLSSGIVSNFHFLSFLIPPLQMVIADYDYKLLFITYFSKLDQEKLCLKFLIRRVFGFPTQLAACGRDILPLAFSYDGCEVFSDKNFLKMEDALDWRG